MDWNTNFYMRKGTAADYTEKNPILAQGEFGLETDTNKAKLGDGVKTWNELDYLGGGSGLPTVQGSGKAMVSVNGQWKEQDGYGYITEEETEQINIHFFAMASPECVDFENPINLEEGSQYLVNFDGIEYNITAEADLDDDGYLGEKVDLEDERVLTFVNYPFFITKYYICVVNNGTHRVKVSKLGDTEELLLDEEIIAEYIVPYSEYYTEGLEPLKGDSDYLVSFDGNNYSIKSSVLEGNTIIGEFTDDGEPMFENYPFIIGSFELSDHVETAISTSEEGYHDLRVTLIEEVSTSISPKYLPTGGFGYEEDNRKFIIWDGDTEGREHPIDPDWPEYEPEYFKVSDLTPIFEILGGIIKTVNPFGEDQYTITEDCIMPDLNTDFAYCINIDGLRGAFVIPWDQFTFEYENESGSVFSLYFEKAGTYFHRSQMGEDYTSELSYGKNIIHKIEAKYIPKEFIVLTMEENYGELITDLEVEEIIDRISQGERFIIELNSPGMVYQFNLSFVSFSTSEICFTNDNRSIRGQDNEWSLYMPK